MVGLLVGAQQAFLRPIGGVFPATWSFHAAAAKAASVGFTFQETRALPSWTPPWASWPPMLQVGVFLVLLALVAAVTPILLGQGIFGLKVAKPKKPREPVKKWMKIGVTDELFDPKKKRKQRGTFQTASAAAATRKRASTDVATAAEVTEVPADDAAVSEASPEERVSAWQRLKEGL